MKNLCVAKGAKPRAGTRACIGFAVALLMTISIPARADDVVTPQAQAAIDRGLKWLAENQQKEDSPQTGRKAGTWHTNVDPSTAISSLAVLAFLARGHTPGEGPYADTIERGVDFVIASQKPDGVLSNSNQNMYDHGASTGMLCEVYGMLDDQRKAKADVALSKAIKLILDAQRRTQGQYAGGWHYQPTQNDADISCSGWQIVALRGAANCGATIPKESLDKAAGWIKRLAVKGEGGFGYQPGGGSNRARAGTGTLCLCLLGQHDAPEALAGGDYLIKNPLKNPGDEFYYYSVYYCSQAVNQLGGKYWDQVYPPLRDTLIARQKPTGSWPDGPGAEQQGLEAYSTAMAVLALSVPYHYLPLYQK